MTYDSEVAADSPWGYWKLDEAAGDFADSSGNGRTSAVSGTLPTYAQTGPSGAADAVDWPSSSASYSNCLGTAAMSGTAGFTSEAWVYLTANPGAIAAVVCNGTSPTGTASTEIGLSIDTSGRPVMYLFNSAARFLTGSALSLNTWHHIVAVYSIATGMRLRVDKVADGTLAQNPLTNAYSRRIWIRGAGYNNGGGAIRISHAAFYSNVALTDARIDAHYDAMAAGGGTAASGTASLSLSASGSTEAPGAGSAALALSATGAAAAPASGTASLSLSASGTAAAPGDASGTASLSLSASGGAAAAAAASASLSLSADGAATLPASGSASLTLSATGTVDSIEAAAGAATLTLSAAGTATLIAAGTATLELSGDGAAMPLILTDTTNALAGRVRHGIATVTITRPVATVPPAVTLGQRYDKALAFPEPVMVDGRPT